MSTLTATPDPATGTVQLSIDKTATVTTLIRADANGTRPVRTRAGLFPSAGSGSFGLTDHEAALHGPIAYRLDNNAEVWTQFPPAQAPRFTVPFHPELTIPVDLVTGFTASRPQASTVHEIIGREDPIIVSAPMKSRRGTIEAIFDSYEEAAGLEHVLKLGKTVMYRQSENLGQDFYFHALEVSVEPDEDCWKLSTSYVALRPPAGDRAAYGWTFEALAALPGATLESVVSDYESFETLTIGQPL